MKVSDTGEFALIARLTRHLKSHKDVVLGIGDDCAVLDLGSDELLLTTCDSQVEGIHFTLQTSDPVQIGRKALAINVSDIAAMGGKPRYALVSLVLPAQLPFTVLDDIYVGLRQEAERHSTAIVGGNIASTGTGEQLIIDITLLGTARRGHVLTRGGARVGDILCVTGTLGDSAAGLHTLLHPTSVYPPESLPFLQARHRTPQARIHEAQVLARCGPGIITALLDVSDGLSGDLQHLCERSNVGAQVQRAHLPLSQQLQTVAASAAHDPFAWAMHGGEDYELLFTVSPGDVQEVIAMVGDTTGTPVTAIGTILPAEEGMLQMYDNGRVEPLQVKSWNHLK